MTEIRTVAAGLCAGLAPAVALSTCRLGPDERALVDEILELSKSTGAPRASALEVLADSVDSSERRRVAIYTGTAAARQTSLVLGAMPFVTILGAEFVGFPVLGVLVGGVAGWLLVGLGALLSVCGVWWMRRLGNSVPSPPVRTGLMLDLASAIARTSSLTPERRRHLRSLSDSWGTNAEADTLDRLHDLSMESGVPIAGLLAVEANACRDSARQSVRLALELLPGRLLVPVGVCLFPAFIVTTVIPVVISMVSVSVAN